MLAADVNQGWSIDRALEIVPRLGEFGLRWLEEPLRADRPREGVAEVAHRAPVMPLAAGENMRAAKASKTGSLRGRA